MNTDGYSNDQTPDSSFEPRKGKHSTKKKKTPPAGKQPNMMREIMSTLFYILIALIIFLIIRTFLFAPVSVEGDSMVPTLHDDDRLILNKVDSVNRFDIVVFHAPDDSEKQYIKRVIGIPGDTVEVQDEVLYVNGEVVPEEYLQPELFNLSESESFTEDFNLAILTGMTEVPEGQYFLLGDNRQNSKDSRYFGFVEEEAIVGTTDLRFWPLNDFGDANNTNNE